MGRSRVPKSALTGHTTTTLKESSAGSHMFNGQGRKPGLKELGFFDRDKLASEIYGIKPLKAAQVAAEADPNFLRQKITKSSLKGFSTTSKTDHSADPLGPEFRGVTVRKPGLRELGYYNKVRLASEKAGIKPLRACEVAALADPHFERQAPGGLPGVRFTRSMLSGHSTVNSSSVIKQHRGFYSGFREGGPQATVSPRLSIRRHPNANRPRSMSDSDALQSPQRRPKEPYTPLGRSGRLASERAGIKPWTNEMSVEAAKDQSWAGVKGNGYRVNRGALQSPKPRSSRKSPQEVRSYINNRKGYRKPYKAVPDKKLIQVFKLFDNDNDGYVTLDEFQLAFKRLNIKLDVVQLTEVFREIDRDLNGAIDYAEFRAGYHAIAEAIPEAYMQQEMKRSGVSARKAGPRELGKPAKLASERAGIMPARPTY